MTRRPANPEADDERVKLDLDPEDALRALLQVDPEGKPDGDEGGSQAPEDKRPVK